MKKFFGSIMTELQEIMQDFRFASKRFIKYQIATKLLISIILLPLFKVLLSTILKSRGITSLSNALVVKYILSPQGIISIIVTIVISISVILIELGGLIIISKQAYTREEESSFLDVLKLSLSRFKNLLGSGGLILLLYILVITPFLGMGFDNSLISNIKIPGFIQDYIVQSDLYSILFIIVIALLIFISRRWIFSLHIIMLENKSATQALKESGKLIKKKFMKILLSIIVSTLIILLISLVAIIVFLIISAVILSLVDITTSLGLAVFGGIFVVGALLIVGVTFVVVPLEIHYFTRLYYHVSGIEAKPLRLKTKQDKVTWIDRIFAHKKILITISILIFMFISLITGLVINDMDNIKRSVQITAHRGSSVEAPENTLVSLEVAIENGADYVEIDVQEAKDGNIVLLHDSTLKRTTGLNKGVWELTLSEIKELDAGSWFGGKYAGEKIPTLEEVIRYTKSKIKLNIEVKKHGHEENFIPSVVKLIKEHDLVSTCVVSSLDYELLQEVEELMPEIRTGYIMFIALGDLRDLNVDFYSVEATNVTESFVNKAHLTGREVHVWTINEKSDMETMMELGVDNIITDYDRVLRELVGTTNMQ